MKPEAVPLSDLLREALRDVAGVEAAFLFGSAATGTAHPDSDLDLLVVGDSVDTRALYRNLFEVGQLLSRQVNTLRYTRATLADRLASGAHFPRNLLEGPKIWLAGDPGAIAPIATAAAVRFRVNGIARKRPSRGTRRATRNSPVSRGVRLQHE